MKKINDLEIKRSSNGGEPLPAGGYVAKILDASISTYSWGEVLVFSFDIVEGEYTEFFKNKYLEDTNENKKWKGTFRLTVPQEDNQYYDSQKRSFGNAIACIEESNPKYAWNWDEKTLKDKYVGVLFRNYEYDVDGRQGWSTECCSFTSVDEIREKKFKMPKDKPLKKQQESPAAMFADIKNIENELPF